MKSLLWRTTAKKKTKQEKGGKNLNLDLLVPGVRLNAFNPSCPSVVGRRSARVERIIPKIPNTQRKVIWIVQRTDKNKNNVSRGD